MSDLLLEIFSEEIPARMQSRASDDLKRMVTDGLKKAGLDFETAETFATPRRLILKIDGLPEKSPATREEKKGPRVGAPEQALQGFMRGAGISDISEAQIITDPKKGDFYVSITEKPGQKASDVIADLIPVVVRQFPWPKSMRWGAGKLKWVRPLHSILCVLDGKTVKFEVDGIESGNTTLGHRFMAPKPIKVKDFADYEAKLRDARVIIDPQERADIIEKEAQALAKAKKLNLVEDEGLLRETAGLVEWPTVLMGDFDKAFLDVPPEVLTSSLKAHQKCFSVKKGTKLSNQFILVSNLIAEDGGKKITQGNERVIRARLSDAKFFWEQDKKTKLDDLLPKLKDITFHEKLGTQAERVERIKKLARELAPMVGADADKAERAAELCKADLVTEMVGEFPDLQGLMGKYYALAEGEPEEVAQALEDHYKPQGPGDAVPTEPVSITVALADKLDTLVGFWAIDEKPTGSKDPYALRRAALGVIRIILENDVRVPLLKTAGLMYPTLKTIFIKYDGGLEGVRQKISEDPRVSIDEVTEEDEEVYINTRYFIKFGLLREFFFERLHVLLRGQGIKHGLVDSVFSLEDKDDLLLIVKRVDALGNFLGTDDGTNLVAGIKRAQNILDIEEKKDKCRYGGMLDGGLLEGRQEKTLSKAIGQVTEQAEFLISNEDFEGAMQALAKLRAPVDDFFENVIVNADDKAVRENRLKLLSQIRAATLKVADFSKIIEA